MADRKLVFKNTLFLYGRVLLSMLIGLYASRVVLQQLGVDDFGIYSVVGSLAMFFSYLNYGISSSLQRFMSVEIAVDNHHGLQKCFSTSLVSVLILSGILILLCETVGLWALRDIMDIPAGRESDALFVFQVSIFILIMELLKTCFQSLIVSYEKMSFFAYISIAEALLKLLVVFVLMWVSWDKLRLYALLLAGVSVIVVCCYGLYCRINFPKIKVTLKGGTERLREIFSFTGWNTLASFADLCYMQGTNLVLNIFYGVAYNATMGITNQVKNALFSFSKNLQTASNPHLTKEFARGEYASFSSMAMMISVVSFLLFFMFGLPILLNTEEILQIWLTLIPPDASVFIRLVIIFCLIDSLVGSLWVAMQAFGHIRNYQIIISIGWMLSLPIMFGCLHYGAPPSCVLVVQIVINAILLVIRLGFAVKFCHIVLIEYLKNVVGRLLITIVVASVIPVALFLSIDGDVLKLIVTTGFSFVTVPIAGLFIGLPPGEREKVMLFIKKKIGHGKVA